MDKKREKIIRCILLFLIIFVPAIIFLIRDLDNDTWFMLNHGRYILANGLYPEYEPFTVHEGLHFTFQKWLCCILFWVIYNYLGKTALKLFCLAVYYAFCFAMYKLLMFIKPNSSTQHLFVLAFMNIAMAQFYYTRPQLFTYLFLAIELLVLEKYVKEHNAKLLAVIPLLSVVEMQLHSTIWPILLIFMLPYMFDFSFATGFTNKVKFITNAQYKRLPVWITFVASLLVGFINPYGFESIVYLVKSLGIEELSLLIGEVRAPRLLSVNTLVIAFTIAFCLYGLYKKKSVELRYVFLVGGTALMAMMSTRQLSFLIIPAAFVFEYFFDLKNIKQFTVNVVIIIMCASMVVPIYDAYLNQVKRQSTKVDVGNFLAEYQPSHEGVKVFNLGDEGCYLEFLGFKAFNDTRAEIFSDKINNKENVLREVYNLETQTESYKKYIDKYDYKYVVMNNYYKLQIDELNSDKNMKKIYKNKRYSVYEIQS